MCGMFQYEVAERICEHEGSKKYGIISVITQAYYKTSLLFEVSNNLFSPPPKVNSAVISLKRKKKHKFLAFFTTAIASEIFNGRISFWLQDKDF